MRKILLWVLVMTGAVAMAATLSACGGKHKAGKTAEAFLRAYHTDLDFAKAKTYATAGSAATIDERRDMTALNPYAKSETPVLVFKDLQIGPDKTTAEFTYTLNRSERTLYLQQVDGEWKVDLEKEAQMRADGLQQLPAGGEGGFAAAASGPVVYKERKR